MNEKLYKDSLEIINYAIDNCKPEKLIKDALKHFKKPKGNIYMIAIGKAAYPMAKETLNNINVYKGIVITKYGYRKEDLNNTEIYEAGHPLTNKDSIRATEKAIELVKDVTKDDSIIFLLSGGGSSLFELPLIELDEYIDITNRLILSSATIEEINAVRKKISSVKGGKFANLCKPAKIFNVILSDVISNKLDVVASGPTLKDTSSIKAIDVINKYSIDISKETKELIEKEDDLILDNVKTYSSIDNKTLIEYAALKSKQLGYEVIKVEKQITSDINKACSTLLSYLDNNKKKNIIIAGGEIVLNVKGNGLGGRNQELALRLAKNFKNNNIAAFCVGSDGTDGPTDAAGGFADKSLIGDDLDSYLINNDSYHYLLHKGGLIKTGPTMTNVCDLYCLIVNELK